MTCFLMFPVFFCIFSLRCDHDLSLFYFPYFFISLYVYHKYSTTQHTKNTIHNHTHAHTCTPATDRDLESGLSKSNTRKNPRNMPEKMQSQENLWRRLVSISTGKSFVCGKVAKDESNPIGAGSLRSFPHSQEKATDL